MTSPALVALNLGETPSEPGVYAYRVGNGSGVARVEYGSGGPDGELIAVEFGTMWSAPLSALAAFTWTARIFPDRIGQEG